MTLDIKTQVEALKSGKWSAIKAEEVILLTNGFFINYIDASDFFLDLRKIKEFKKEISEFYFPENINKTKESANLTNRLIREEKGKRLFVAVEDEYGERVWFDEKYIKLFKNYNIHLVKQCGTYIGCSFSSGENLKGFLLRTNINKEW